MIQTSSVFPERDKDAERRRALGKVYSLLLRLAEEAEKQTVLSDTPTEEKNRTTVDGQRSKKQRDQNLP